MFLSNQNFKKKQVVTKTTTFIAFSQNLPQNFFFFFCSKNNQKTIAIEKRKNPTNLPSTPTATSISPSDTLQGVKEGCGEKKMGKICGQSKTEF